MSVRITDSSVAFQSEHRLTVKEERSERLRAWVGAEPREQVTLSPAVKLSPLQNQPQAAPSPAGGEGEIESMGVQESRQQLLVEKLLHTGPILRARISSKVNREAQHALEELGRERQALRAQSSQQARAGFGVEYDLVAVRTTREEVDFNASGKVTTSDGRDLSFALSVSQEQLSTQRVETHVRLGDAKVTDPLVLSDRFVTLSPEKVSFDLNSDGQAEQIASLGEGSSFLALDKDGNGTIDHGGELFGPATGSGFGELAALDSDGNRWIDESDARFLDLRSFRPGGSTLTLKEAGIGAIYLGSADTPLELDSGVVRSTGVYLSEAGEAGVVQHVDLKV